MIFAHILETVMYKSGTGDMIFIKIFLCIMHKKGDCKKNKTINF